jgi:DNA primase
VKAVVFPEGEDPDSYSRKVGTQAFQTYLDENSRDFIGFKIGLYQEEFERNPIRKAEVIREIVQSIGKIPDPIIRSVYAKEASGLLEIEEEIIHAELNKSLLKTQKEAYNKQQQEAEVEEAIQELIPAESGITVAEILKIQEREMIRLLLNYGLQILADQEISLSNYLLAEVEDLEMSTPLYTKILKIYREALAKGEVPSVDYFIGFGDNEIQKEVIDLVTMRHEVSVHWEDKHKIIINKESDDLSITGYKSILRLKKKMVSKMMDEAKMKLKHAEQERQTEEKIIGFQELYFELKKVQLEIDRELGIVIG